MECQSTTYSSSDKCMRQPYVYEDVCLYVHAVNFCERDAYTVYVAI